MRYKGSGSGGQEGEEELEGLEGKEITIRIHYMRKEYIFNKKEIKKQNKIKQ